MGESSYRNEEMKTLKELGIHVQYLILPDNRHVHPKIKNEHGIEYVSHTHIQDMLQGPLFKDGGVAGITF